MSHESTTTVLRVNEVSDRDTFVNMFDSEASLKEGTADLGIATKVRPPGRTQKQLSAVDGSPH